MKTQKEKIEKYKNLEIKIIIDFWAIEHMVRDKNDYKKLVQTVYYEYSRKIFIDTVMELSDNGRAFYDEHTLNLPPDDYITMIINSGVYLAKEIIDNQK